MALCASTTLVNNPKLHSSAIHQLSNDLQQEGKKYKAWHAAKREMDRGGGKHVTQGKQHGLHEVHGGVPERKMGHEGLHAACGAKWWPSMRLLVAWHEEQRRVSGLWCKELEKAHCNKGEPGAL